MSWLILNTSSNKFFIKKKNFSKICWACITNVALIFVFKLFDETIFIRPNRAQAVD